MADWRNVWLLALVDVSGRLLDAALALYLLADPILKSPLPRYRCRHREWRRGWRRARGGGGIRSGAEWGAFRAYLARVFTKPKLGSFLKLVLAAWNVVESPVVEAVGSHLAAEWRGVRC